MSDWAEHNKIDFSDINILKYNIDTRDFHVSTSTSRGKEINFDKLKKYPDRFFHTPEELTETINRLFIESVGEVKWRYLALEGEGKKHSHGWEMKYLRIYRAEEGLVVCNDENYALNKDILSCSINKDLLHAH